MEQRLKKAFQAAKYEPDSSLVQQIWVCIQTKNDQRFAGYKLFVFSFVGLFSLVGLIPAVRMLVSDFTQSGLYDYFSLAFSNGGSLSSYWKEFLFTILESIPLLSTILILSLIFIFFLSIKLAIKQMSKNSVGSLALSI